MLEFLARRWFLIALVATIATGHLLGEHGSAAVVSAVDLILNDTVKACLNAAVLFCMSVTLDGQRFKAALLSPAPVVWAVVVNAVLMPLSAPLLMPLQLIPDFAAGILIAASVPSTMAAASVWTRRAGGNDAISLLVTLITNAGCVLYTPYWLLRFGASAVELNIAGMIQKLLLTALLPTILGQAARRHAATARWADRHKVALGTAAQIGILLIVFSAACDGGSRMAADTAGTLVGHPPPTLSALAIVAASCIGLHLAAMGVAAAGSRVLRVSREDSIAVAFAASQKTLPIGVLIATDPQMFGSVFPWAVFPMLIYHASQLFIDAFVADAMASRTASAAVGSGSRTGEKQGSGIAAK
jgi:sodium/bile acid cotransporter 7